MIEYLKTLWLRIVKKLASPCLESRVRLLESKTKAMEGEIHALVKRLPPAPEKIEGQEDPKAVRPLSKSWFQRRARLEATDGGRIPVGKT